MSEKQQGKRPQQTLNYPRTPPPIPPPKCPRCYSANTKFCYYNNYSVTQPRYFCKDCRRYWTHGGIVRNIPSFGSGRKRGRHDFASSSSQSSKPPPSRLLVSPPQPMPWILGSPYNSAHVEVGSNVSHGTFRQQITEGMQMQPFIGGGFFNQTPSNFNSGGLNPTIGAPNVVFGGEAPPTQGPSTLVSTNLSSFEGFSDFSFPFQRQQLQPQLRAPAPSSIWTSQNMALNNNINATVNNPNIFLQVVRDPTRTSNVTNINEWSELNEAENEGDADLQSYKPLLP